ncbi:hypothetical protein JW979_11715 [bacterium]|nr:hypothetical protein [candidate division CSSED10-310 bacterium]
MIRIGRSLRLMTMARPCRLTAFAMIVTGLLIGFSAVVGDSPSPSPQTVQSAPTPTILVPMEWLTVKTTIAEAEQKNMVADNHLGSQPVPFGFMNDEWQKFKDTIQKGDELWEFDSPEEYWMGLSGSAGLCIVRKGTVIDVIFTKMN